MLGLHDFLERKLAAYNDASEAVRIKLEEKEIERNRPKSPKKDASTITAKSKVQTTALKKAVAARKPLVLDLKNAEEIGDMYSDKSSAREVKKPQNKSERVSPVK